MTRRIEYRRMVHRAVLLAALACSGCVEGPARVPTIHVIDEPRSGAWSSVVVGRDHSCALDLERRAFCWGSNLHGQLGVPETPTECGTEDEPHPCSLVPMQVASGVRFEMLSAGAVHTCGIALDRTAYCWGSNETGQLGDVGSSGADPLRVRSAAAFAWIAAGYDHSCAVTTAAELLCWGDNRHGQIGSGVEGGLVFLPAHVVPDSSFQDVSAGNRASCGRTAGGTVMCWGAIWTHREGVFEFTFDRPTPQPVPGSPSMSGVSVGGFTSCGFDATGFAYCWGGNPNGQMGTGDTDGSVLPRRVASVDEFAGVTAGLLQTCGTTTDGAGYCWGDNTFGQLGIGTAASGERCGHQNLPCASRPTRLFGRHEWVHVSTGLGQHTCGVTALHNVYCWGLGTLGQRGDGTRGYREVVPIRIVPARQ